MLQHADLGNNSSVTPKLQGKLLRLKQALGYRILQLSEGFLKHDTFSVIWTTGVRDMDESVLCCRHWVLTETAGYIFDCLSLKA